MKLFKQYLTLISLTLIIAGTSTLSAQTETNTMSKEDDPQFKEKREQWYENMHRIEDGMNWKIIDRETGSSKYKIKKYEIEYLLSKNKHDQILSDTVQIEMMHGVWIEKGSDNLSGRVHTADIDFDRGFIYVASSGGNVWRGTLEGKDWTCLNNSIKFNNIKTVRIAEIDGNKRIIVASNSPAQVHFSDNEGITWERASGLEQPLNSGTIKRGILRYNSQDYYILTSQYNSEIKSSETAIYYSDDAAATFRQIHVFEGTPLDKDIWTSPFESSAVYYVSNTEFGSVDIDEYEVINNNISSIFEYGSPSKLFIKGSLEGGDEFFSLACWVSSSKNTHFYYSDDGGESWLSTGSVASGPFMDNSFAISYKRPEYLFYGGVELYVSDNAGYSFEKVNTWQEYYGDIVNKLHADIPGIDIFRKPSGKELILISTDGGLYKSEDNCKTVNNISLKGLNVSQYYSVYTDRHTGSIYAGSQDQGFQRALIDSGKTVGFEQTISGDYGHLTSSDGGIHLWTEYITFAMLYQNLNNPLYTISKTWSFKGKNWLWLAPMQAHPKNPKVAYILGGSEDNGSYVWKLEYDDLRINASQLSYNFKTYHDNANLSAIGISPIFPEYIYVAGAKGEFFLSKDAGETWQKTEGHDGPNRHYFYGSHILPSKKNFGTLYICGSGYSEDGVMVSHDHGKTFIGITDGLPNTMVYDLAMSEDEKVIFAATQLGAYAYYVDTGKWYDIASFDSPDQIYWTVEYINETKTARFGTYGRGVWDFKIIDYFTNIPTQTQISGNVEINIQPNPVTHNAVIKVSSDILTECSIKIYDIEGRVVAELFNGKLDKEKELIWGKNTNSNRVVPAGVYMLTVSGNGNTWYKKLLVN